jgi:two-component system, OmpR family, response regulator
MPETLPEPPPAASAGKVLVVEDDPTTAADIVRCLADNGFHSERQADGPGGLRAALRGGYTAITLDRMLPGMDGLELLRGLRAEDPDTPVLMISALSDVDDRVQGLRAGGDDYLVKPFAPAELVARLEALLRRRRRETPETHLRVGELELDLVRREARRGGRRIELLPMEYKLLEFMMRNAGRSLSRRFLFETVWGYHFDPGTNLIDVHVGKLRRKIDAAGSEPMIRTERGVGYVLHAP